ncbi:MAG: hypothetical protein SGARI_000408 [Bacillariaceae sp.]
MGPGATPGLGQYTAPSTASAMGPGATPAGVPNPVPPYAAIMPAMQPAPAAGTPAIMPAMSPAPAVAIGMTAAAGTLALEADGGLPPMKQAAVAMAFKAGLSFLMFGEQDGFACARKVVTNAVAKQLLQGIKFIGQKCLFSLMGSTLMAVIKGVDDDSDSVCALWCQASPHAPPKDPICKGNVKCIGTTDQTTLVLLDSLLAVFKLNPDVEQGLELVCNINVDPHFDTFWYNVDNDVTQLDVCGVNASDLESNPKPNIQALTIDMVTKTFSAKEIKPFRTGAQSILPSDTSSLQGINGHGDLLSVTMSRGTFNSALRGLVLDRTRYHAVQNVASGFTKDADWIVGNKVALLTDDSSVKVLSIVNSRAAERGISTEESKHLLMHSKHVVGGTTANGELVVSAIADKKAHVWCLDPEYVHDAAPSRPLGAPVEFDFKNAVVGQSGSVGGSVGVVINERVAVGSVIYDSVYMK